MNRKKFIQEISIGGSILFIAPAIFTSCSEDEINTEITIDLTSARFSSLKTIGGFAYKDNLIIIRTGSDSYKVLSKICTHEGCEVTYDSTTNRLPCPCHGSVFTINGAVVNGPAPKSLKEYSVQLNGNNLIIS